MFQLFPNWACFCLIQFWSEKQGFDNHDSKALLTKPKSNDENWDESNISLFRYIAYVGHPWVTSLAHASCLQLACTLLSICKIPKFVGGQKTNIKVHTLLDQKNFKIKHENLQQIGCWLHLHSFHQFLLKVYFACHVSFCAQFHQQIQTKPYLLIT